MDNHKRMPWHAKPVQEVFQMTKTSEQGLSDAEAAERLRKNGRNELNAKPPKSIWEMLISQVIDPMVLILIGASALLQNG